MSVNSAKVITGKRESKRLEIIRIASLMMNERGATSIKLSDVAKGAGLSRNALYYYFKDRTDLIYACYLNASKATEADLYIAQHEKLGTLQKLSTYIERALCGDSSMHVMLTDVDLLPQPKMQVILEIRERNFRTLETILKEGIYSGEIKRVDTQITTQMIQGMLNWAKLWYKWTDIEDGKLKNHSAVAASGIKQIIFYGISPNRNFQFTCNLHLPLMMATRANTFDPKSLHQEKKLQIIGAASFLFNCKGINAVSLDDIADHIGATKGAVYHYFKNKQALINACFVRAFDQYEKIVQIASENNLDSLSQLLVALHLNCQAQLSETPPLILQGGTSSFAIKYADRSQAITKKLDEIRSNSINVDLNGNADKNIIRLAAGTFFWISAWYPKQSKISGSFLADEICKVFSTGIAVANSAQDTCRK